MLSTLDALFASLTDADRQGRGDNVLRGAVADELFNDGRVTEAARMASGDHIVIVDGVVRPGRFTAAYLRMMKSAAIGAIQAATGWRPRLSLELGRCGMRNDGTVTVRMRGSERTIRRKLEDVRSEIAVDLLAAATIVPTDRVTPILRLIEMVSKVALDGPAD